MTTADPFTLSATNSSFAYRAADFKQAYVEPTAVGRTLVDMPLFLEPGLYVPVPLEKT